MPKDKLLNNIEKAKQNCTICAGTGYSIVIIDNAANINTCDCVRPYIQQYKYIVDSGIPKRYVNWTIDNLYDKFIKENQEAYEYICNYINNLDENIDNGISFWLASTPGLAKSSIAAYITRLAIDKGYKGYFCTAAKLLNEKFNALGSEESAEFIDYIVNDVQILVIEEIEKVYLKDDAAINNYLFYELLADIYDDNKTVIITSNKTRDEVCERLPDYIVDRLYTIDYIPLVGKYSGRLL